MYHSQWRFTLYVSLFAVEICLVLSPTSSSFPPLPTSPFAVTSTYTTHTILHSLFPQRTTHQHILFLHQFFVSLSIALSHVVPVLLSAFPSPAFSQMSQQDHRQLAGRLAGLSAMADRETSIMMNTVLHSIASPAEEHESISSLARPRPFELPNQPPFFVPASSPYPPAFYSDIPSPGQLLPFRSPINILLLIQDVKKHLRHAFYKR
jgi:hypothetical protein